MPVPNLNRSPSPLPHRPRNSELNSTTRRSFSGNPFHKPSVTANPRSFNSSTPANSPSGFGRRLSGNCDGCDHEKENDQSIKPVKSRPAANGSKNFMAPTISAAYKQSPSPRKKVLVDRNEPVRTSISLSEGKASFFSSNHNVNVSKSESFIHQNNVEAHLEPIANDSQENEANLERPLVSKVLKKVTFADSTLDVEFEADSVVSDSDCVVTDLSAKNKPFLDSCMSPVIAPLDADPSLPPYDPKTNYLSPRPQFIHYKPNERIEILLNKEKELDDERVKLFEDNLSSFEHSSNSADEPQRDTEDSSTDEIESQKEREENVHDFESLTCVRSNAHENSEMVMNVKEIIHDFESLTCGSSNALDISEKVINVKEKDKKGVITRWRLIFLVMVVLLVSCYSISETYSPAIDSTMLKAINISQLHTPGATIDLAKANFYVFTQRFKRSSVEYMSHLSLLISNIGQRDQLSLPLQFMNLTELQNNVFVISYHNMIQQGREDSPENLESDFSEEESIEWDDIEEELNDEAAEQFEEETVGDSISDINNEDKAEGDADLMLTVELPSPAAVIGNEEQDVSHLDTEWQDDMLLEHYGATSLEIQEVLTEHTEEKIGSNANLGTDAIEKPSSEYTNLQITSDVSTESSPEKFEGNVNLDSDPNVEEPLSEEVSPKTPCDEIQHHPFTELHSELKPFTKTSAYYVMGATASLILAVVSIAFAVFNNKERGNRTEPNSDHLLSKKTVFATPSAMEQQQMDDEKLCSHNSPAEEDYDVGESCPSEMSSFQSDKKSFKSAIDEVQSREKRQRKYSKRESFSSSDNSLGGGGGSSLSYGSFTTYERIQIKNANGDDEAVTPVRRSSRIRSYVMS